MGRILTFLARLDDRLNPITVREARQLVRSGLLIWLVHLMLIGQLVVFGWALLIVDPTAFSDTIGPVVFQVMMAILGFACLLIVPAYAAARLGLEAATGELLTLAMPGVSFERLVFGKFYAAMILVGVIASTILPFAVLALMLRGVGVLSIAVAVSTTLAASAVCVFASIVFSCHLGPGPSRFIVPLLIAGGLLFAAFQQAMTNFASTEMALVAVGNCCCCCFLPTPVLAAAIIIPAYFTARGSTIGRRFRKVRVKPQPPRPPAPATDPPQEAPL